MECLIMKIRKISVLFLALLLTALLFTGCNKNIEVTSGNVKDVAKPTIEAAFYLCNSYFYDIEKDANGKPVTYPSDSDIYSSYYKITTSTTVDKIEKEAAKYSTDANKAKEKFVLEKDGVLYAVNPDWNAVEAVLDINSIRLVKQEGDIYYIAVDEYVFDGVENEDGSPKYADTLTYKMKSVDGVLQIQGEPQAEEKTPVNTGKDCEFIGSYDKFLGPVAKR